MPLASRSTPLPWPELDVEKWRALVERELAGQPFASLLAEVSRVQVEPAYFAQSLHGLRAQLVGQASVRQQANWSAIQDYSWGETSARAAIDAIGRAQARGENEVWLTSQGVAVLPTMGSNFALGPSGLTVEELNQVVQHLAAPGGAASVGPTEQAPLRLWLDVDLEAQLSIPATSTLATVRALDPLRNRLRWGRLERELAQEMAQAAAHFVADERSTWMVDARVVHEAGGTPAQELAFVVSALAWAADHWGEGEARRAWWPRVTVAIASSGDFLLEMAKIRALRWLLPRLAQSWKMPALCPALHAFSGLREWTSDDPWNNVLRATIASAAAALGGADRITIAPFDAPRGQIGELAERLAANLHLLLADEAQLDKVVDPGRGAYSVEALTADLVSQAWELVRTVAVGGGLATQIQTGKWQAQVEQAQRELMHAVARGEKVILGANLHPSQDDGPLVKVDRATNAQCRLELPSAALAPVRLASGFEDLRMRVKALDSSATPRQVMIAVVGKRRERAANVAFLIRVVRCGGFAGDVHEVGDATELASHLHARRVLACVIVAAADQDCQPFLRVAQSCNVPMYFNGWNRPLSASASDLRPHGWFNQGDDALAWLNALYQHATANDCPASGGF